MSRFSLPPDPVFQALNASIGFDWRLYALRRRAVARPRDDARGRRDHQRRRPRRAAQRARPRAGRARRQRVRLPGLRRGHPHGGRAAADRDRRRRSAASCTPPARATTRSRPTWRCSPARTRCGRSRRCRTCRPSSCRSPRRTWTGRCPATRTSSARSRCTSRTTCWPTSGCSGATLRRFEVVLGSTTELPLGAGALAGVNFPTDRRLVASELGFAGVVAELDRRGLQPRLRPRLPGRRGHLRDAPVAAGRGDRALVLGGVRVLRGDATPGRRAPRSCRRRRTRTRPSCCARRRRAIVAHLAALHGVMHGLPLTYNKDMQEDKEHLFDAVDTLGAVASARRAGCSAGSRFERERLAGAATDEMIAAVDVADMLVKRGVPFRQSHGDRRRPRADGGRVRPHAVAADAARSSPSTPTSSTTSSTRCYPRGRGWSPRRARAGRRWRACASSSPTRGRRWTRAS